LSGKLGSQISSEQLSQPKFQTASKEVKEGCPAKRKPRGESAGHTTAAAAAATANARALAATSPHPSPPYPMTTAGGARRPPSLLLAPNNTCPPSSAGGATAAGPQRPRLARGGGARVRGGGGGDRAHAVGKAREDDTPRPPRPLGQPPLLPLCVTQQACSHAARRRDLGRWSGCPTPAARAACGTCAAAASGGQLMALHWVRRTVVRGTSTALLIRCSGRAAGGPPLVHSSAQPEPFSSPKLPSVSHTKCSR